MKPNTRVVESITKGADRPAYTEWWIEDETAGIICSCETKAQAIQLAKLLNECLWVGSPQ